MISGLKQSLARFLSLFRRATLDREFDEEAKSHLELAVEDFMTRGLPEPEARRLARIKFGAIEASKDAHRDSRGFAWLDGLLYDLRFSVRGVVRDRGFAFTVIVMLALAIGLNVTAFRVMSTMLFGGYPLVKQNERLLYINERYPGPGCCVSYMDFEVWRDQAHSFQDMAFGVPKFASVSETDGDGYSRDGFLWAMTSNTFGLLGVRPALGRDFTPADEVPGAPPTMIVSHSYWHTRMSGRPDVIGRTVRVNGVPSSIIGVLPQGFEFIQREDIWLPLAQTADLDRVVANGGLVFGRLAKGASETSAHAEVEAINERLARERPATNRDVYPVVSNMRDHAGPKGTLIYGSVWAGAWLVLCIACANLANLTLARTQGRARELSTRMALGAGRGRVIRQLLLENSLLSAAGGLLGWLAANWATWAWAAATTSPGQIVDYSDGIGTVAYLIGVAVSTTALITFAPIARLWRMDLNGVLKGESRGATLSRTAKAFSRSLVAVQMTLAIVLIGAAGVLGRSLWNVLAADVGVKEPEKVLVGRFDLPRGKYATAESRVAFAEALQARLGTMPGVESSAVSNARPTDDFEPHRFEWEPQIGTIHGSPIFGAGPGYFQTIGVSLLAGRDFSNTDRPEAPPVIVVNQRFAQTYFPGENAVGQRIRLYEKRQLEPGPWRTIVGVVANITQNDWTRQHFLPAAYVPFGQDPEGSVWFFARTRGVSDAVASALRIEIRKMDANQELLDFSTLKASIGVGSPQPAYQYRELSRHAVIAPIYAGLALLLAAIGLYSVISHSVSQRTKEIAVRMALGGTGRDIRRLIFGEGMLPVTVGLMVGLIASLAVNRILQSQLVGVSAYDPITLMAAPVVLILITVIACQIPSRRAIRVDPAVALRHD
jgi:predicted permease